MGNLPLNFDGNATRPYVYSREQYSSWRNGKDAQTFLIPGSHSCLVLLTSQNACSSASSRPIRKWTSVLENTEFPKKTNFQASFFLTTSFSCIGTALIMTVFKNMVHVLWENVLWASLRQIKHSKKNPFFLRISAGLCSAQQWQRGC